MGRSKDDGTTWDAVARRLQADLMATETVRDQALGSAHGIVATCRRAISAAHRGDAAALQSDASDARARLHDLEARLDGAPAVRHGGLLEGARQEVAEAALVAAYFAGQHPPTHEAIAVPAPAYALGLGDFIGELRRFALGALADDDAATARRHLGAMQAAFTALQTLDAPRGVANVKRAQDVARSLLDRTLGEVTVATAAARIAAATRPLDTTR